MEKVRRKKGWLLAFGLGAVLLCALGVLAAILLPKLFAGREMLRAAEGWLDAPDQAASAQLQAEFGEEEVRMDALVSRVCREEGDVWCIEKFGIPLYYSRGLVLLENGRAFSLPGNSLPTLSPQAGEAAEPPRFRLGTLFRLRMEKSRGDGGTEYTLSAKGEDARWLLSRVLSGAEEYTRDLESVRICLSVRDGLVTRMEAEVQGRYEGRALRLLFSLTPEAGSTPTVPRAVWDAVQKGEGEAALTGDLVELGLSLARFAGRDRAEAHILLQADCGLFTLDEALFFTMEKGESGTQTTLQRDGEVIYRSGGDVPAFGAEAAAGSAGWIEIVYRAILEGELAWQAGQAELGLGARALEEMAYALVPQLESMPVTLDEGCMRILSRDGSLSEAEIRISGSVEVLFLSAPVTVTARFIPVN